MGAVLIIVFYMGNQNLYNTQAINFQNIDMCEKHKQDVIDAIEPSKDGFTSTQLVIKSKCIPTAIQSK